MARPHRVAWDFVHQKFDPISVSILDGFVFQKASQNGAKINKKSIQKPTRKKHQKTTDVHQFWEPSRPQNQCSGCSGVSNFTKSSSPPKNVLRLQKVLQKPSKIHPKWHQKSIPKSVLILTQMLIDFGIQNGAQKVTKFGAFLVFSSLWAPSWPQMTPEPEKHSKMEPKWPYNHRKIYKFHSKLLEISPKFI